MRIATTYENGQIFQHFGRTPQFKFYDVEDKRIAETRVVPTSGGGHGAIPGFLKESGVDAVVCGGLGAPMRAGIEAAGIKLYAGNSGNADAAVEALLAGKLDPGNPGSCSDAGCHHAN